jgi:hypothetical protein
MTDTTESVTGTGSGAGTGARTEDVDRLIRMVSRFLLRNSAEGTFDLHLRLRDIGRAYGVQIQSLAMMEGLVVTTTHADGSQRTDIVHAQPSLERLDQVSSYKQLDRQIVEGRLTAPEAIGTPRGAGTAAASLPLVGAFRRRDAVRRRLRAQCPGQLASVRWLAHPGCGDGCGVSGR